MKEQDVVFKLPRGFKKIKFPVVTWQEVFNCFSSKREHKYHYLGITWNIFSKKNAFLLYNLLEEFIREVDALVKPKYIPRWFLNLLHLYGNDNSIVRCRNQKISQLHRNLTGGVMIHDIKEKYGTLRVYGSFTIEIEQKVKALCARINPHLEAY